MKIELKTFQIQATASILEELRWAKTEYSDRQKLQAVVLSAPTGSGKTVMATLLIESLLFGTEQAEIEADATFLWLSDRPQLNRQSRNKMLACSELLTEDRLVEIDSDFDQEVFQGGVVYFLNTQKLGQDKILTSAGDSRTWTIWETIKNTTQLKPTRFYLILDEAHRGLGTGKSPAGEGLQQTVVQKFLKGSEELQPIPLVVGISATPARFQRLLEADSARQVRNVTVDPAEVRESGLLKDRVIVFHPDAQSPASQGAEFTLLAEATREWLHSCEAWLRYCTREDLVPVQPALIVQVEDGGSGLSSKTDIAQLIRTIETVSNTLPEGAICHCFDTELPLVIEGRKIEKVEASAIQALGHIKVVLFKTSLSTGWDCPRAEVMMSFRKVQDATLIAQLIGRMVRSPLARRVADDDVLNSVALFLPNYDPAGLQAVISHLKSDAESASATDVELKERFQTLNLMLWSEDAFDALSKVPTYRLEHGSKVPPVKRLLRLAFHLTQNSLDDDAFSDTQQKLLGLLHELRERLSQEDVDFERKVALADKISLAAWEFQRGEWKVLQKSARLVSLTEDSLDFLFTKASMRVCGAGEGLPNKYFKARVLSEEFANDHVRPKLEFILIADDAASVARMEQFADAEFDLLYNANRVGIRKLPDEARQNIEELRVRGKVPEPVDLKLWRSIVVPTPREFGEPRRQQRHLYVDETSGLATIGLSSWEQSVVDHAQTKPEFVAWLRNFPRKEWALSIPYFETGEYKPHFPDLLVVKEQGDQYLVDILEPHGIAHLGDSWAKAKGMAEYAAKHSFRSDTSVGSVEMQTVDETKGVLHSLDFGRADVQDQMRLVTSREAFLALFDRMRSTETLKSVRLFSEHDCVRLNKAINSDGTILEAGSLGVIISVYEEYLSYLVEFTTASLATVIATVTSQQISLYSQPQK